MLTEKQFNDAFTAAGGWFILTQFETVKCWKGSMTDLVDELYTKGFDAKRSGTNTRVSSLNRIIENGMGKEALLKIRDSKAINKQHPEAAQLAYRLLEKYC